MIAASCWRRRLAWSWSTTQPMASTRSRSTSKDATTFWLDASGVTHPTIAASTSGSSATTCARVRQRTPCSWPSSCMNVGWFGYRLLRDRRQAREDTQPKGSVPCRPERDARGGEADRQVAAEDAEGGG